jgi:hypothetical protein
LLFEKGVSLFEKGVLLFEKWTKLRKNNFVWKLRVEEGEQNW